MTLKVVQRAQNTTARALTEMLMEHETKFHAKHLDHLLEQNAELTGNEQGFLFKGKFWSKTKPNPSTPKHMIHRSLYDEALQMHNNSKKVAEDALTITRHLEMLLRPCQTLQDYRDALPDLFTEYMEQIKSLTRQRPAAWHLKGQAFLEERHERIMELIHFYHASRMLY